MVRKAVQRFELEDDEGRREEFRQLLKSYMRFYSFVAQVVSLGDTGLEKLYSYAAWLIRLLPNREVPADIEITEDMMRLHAFKIEQKEAGSASLATGDTMPLSGAGDPNAHCASALHPLRTASCSHWNLPVFVKPK